MIVLILILSIVFEQECTSVIKHVQQMLIELSYSVGPPIDYGCEGSTTINVIIAF